MPKVAVFKNKPILLAIFIACLVLVLVMVNDKTRAALKLLPMFRGEVALKENNFVITTTQDGLPIIVNKDDPHIGNLRICGRVHSLFNDVIKSFFHRNNRVIIEIGPRFGYNTVNLARTLTPDGKMYIFEGNRSVFQVLKKTIVLNDLEDSLTLKNLAIQDHEGTCEIPDCTSIRELPDGTFSKPDIFSAKCKMLDAEMVDEQRPVDFISIDVHDAEISILKSCNNIVARSPNITIVLTFDNDPVAPETKSEFEVMKALGMKIYLCSQKNKWKKIDDIDELLQYRDVVLVLSKKEIDVSLTLEEKQ